jgi:hypothetical protein
LKELWIPENIRTHDFRKQLITVGLSPERVNDNVYPDMQSAISDFSLRSEHKTDENIRLFKCSRKCSWEMVCFVQLFCNSYACIFYDIKPWFRTVDLGVGIQEILSQYRE